MKGIMRIFYLLLAVGLIYYPVHIAVAINCVDEFNLSGSPGPLNGEAVPGGNPPTSCGGACHAGSPGVRCTGNKNYPAGCYCGECSSRCQRNHPECMGGGDGDDCLDYFCEYSLDENACPAPSASPSSQAQ